MLNAPPGGIPLFATANRHRTGTIWVQAARMRLTPRRDLAESLGKTTKSGEPARSRTENQQIKSPKTGPSIRDARPHAISPQPLCECVRNGPSRAAYPAPSCARIVNRVHASSRLLTSWGTLRSLSQQWGEGSSPFFRTSLRARCARASAGEPARGQQLPRRLFARTPLTDYTIW
jgi:hypothetical protein